VSTRRLTQALAIAWSVATSGGLVARATAQDEPTSGVEAPEPAAAEGATTEAEAGDFPSVLVVARRETPDTLVYDVETFLGEACQVIDSSDYYREARSRGLPPESAEAMAQILPELHPGLDLVVVVGANRRTRATLVSLAYHDRHGFQILEEEHSIRGNMMTEEARVRVLSEVRLGLAVITRPEGGLRELGGGVEPAPDVAPGLAVHVAVQAGAGFGTREISLDTQNGVVGLDTAFFPTAGVQLSVDVEPTARGQLTLGADAEYLTSFALTSADRRIDGTIRETASRSQRIAAGARLHYRVERSLDAVSLGVGLAWSALSFSSEAPVSLPDSTLQGPLVSLSVIIPVAARLFTFVLAPEAHWIVDVGSGLSAIGVDSTGASVGGSARVRLRLLDELFVDATYRESHAFLGTASGRGGVDVERFATLRLVYAR
jgi:hypothetical protein